jgi:hypothetical protein
MMKEFAIMKEKDTLEVLIKLKYLQIKEQS